MGIGFVAFLWLIFLGVIASLFLGLGFLSRKFHVAGVVRDGFISLVLVLVFIAGLITVIAFGSFVLDNLMPSRIFTRSFGFSPTDDVQNLQGSNKIWGKNGFGEVDLKFRSNNLTVEKIISQGFFTERKLSQFSRADDEDLREFLDKPHIRFYVSSNFNKSCDEEHSACTAIFVHDEESGRTYFSSF